MGCGGGSPPESPRATTISISPGSATLSYIGEQVTFTATVLDQNGRRFAGAVVWSSSEESIFTVNSMGEVTAVMNGSATLTASIASLSAEAVITVEQASSALEIVSGAGQVEVLGMALPQPVAVRVLDAGGVAVAGATVAFKASTRHGTADPGTAQTDSDGAASTIWTLGDAIGKQVLVASAGEDASVEITAEAVRVRPRLVNGRLPDAHADIAYSAALRAESGSGSGYRWALSSGGLPDGLSLSAAGEISGVPAKADTFEFDVRLTDGAGASQTSTVRLRVCEGSLDLAPGEFREFLPTSEAHCGFALRASETGAYYRVTLVGTSKEYRPADPVALEITILGGGETSIFDLIRARMFASGGIAAVAPGAGATSSPDSHLARRANERQMFSELAARSELRPLPNLKGFAAQPAPPAQSRDFVLGSPGTLADNCRLTKTRTAELLVYNDYAAFYAEPDVMPAPNKDHVQVLADFYGDYGARVIDEYFGGVSDVDGDGRITVYIDSELRRSISGVVWLGDFLSKDDCAASNEAELVRLNRSWFDLAYFSLTGTMVHEAQHLSSNYQWILRNAGDPPLDVFGKLRPQPIWVDEGRAEIAKEMSSRLAWEALGGPMPHEAVTRAHLLAHAMRSSDLHGILYVLGGAKQALSADLHSLRRYVYGAGWHFFRFLGDWRGNPAGVPLGDAGLFRNLNDSATPGGIQGIERVAGQQWEDLMVEYAVAASLAGTTAPIREDVPRFKTYDFTGLNIEDYFFKHPGRYPWPATMTGEGSEALLWAPLGVSRRLEGQLAQNGLRIHDFRARRAGDTALFRVEGPPHARAIVLRIPDQSESPED